MQMVKNIKIIKGSNMKDLADDYRWMINAEKDQIALFIKIGVECKHCGYKYKSVADFIIRSPLHHAPKKIKSLKQVEFVCDGCFPVYMQLLREKARNG